MSGSDKKKDIPPDALDKKTAELYKRFIDGEIEVANHKGRRSAYDRPLHTVKRRRRGDGIVKNRKTAG